MLAQTMTFAEPNQSLWFSNFNRRLFKVHFSFETKNHSSSLYVIQTSSLPMKNHDSHFHLYKGNTKQRNTNLEVTCFKNYFTGCFQTVSWDSHQKFTEFKLFSSLRICRISQKEYFVALRKKTESFLSHKLVLGVDSWVT